MRSSVPTLAFIPLTVGALTTPPTSSFAAATCTPTGAPIQVAFKAARTNPRRAQTPTTASTPGKYVKSAVTEARRVTVFTPTFTTAMEHAVHRVPPQQRALLRIRLMVTCLDAVDVAVIRRVPTPTLHVQTPTLAIPETMYAPSVLGTVAPIPAVSIVLDHMLDTSPWGLPL